MKRMKIELTRKDGQPIMLPTNYNHYLQGFIYQHFADKSFAGSLHNALPDENDSDDRAYKFFTFSGVRENGVAHGPHLVYGNHISFDFASGKNDICDQLYAGLIAAPTTGFGPLNPEVEVRCIHENPPMQFNSNEMSVRLISPIVVTVHNTQVYGIENVSRFVSPDEFLFYDIIEQNLAAKYHKLTGIKHVNIHLEIVERKSHLHLVHVSYKGREIEAYGGDVVLHGDPRMLQIAYYCGLGLLGSCGFGMIEEVHVPAAVASTSVSAPAMAVPSH